MFVFVEKYVSLFLGSAIKIGSTPGVILVVKGQEVLSVVRSKVVLFMLRKGFFKIFFYNYLSFWC